jgi:hypothetical protein
MNLLMGGRLITALKLPIWGGIMNREQRTPSEFWPIRNLPNCLFQNQISNLLSQTATISLDIFIGSRIEFRRGWLRKQILLPMLLILKSTYWHWRASNFLKISTATHLLNRKAKKKLIWTRIWVFRTFERCVTNCHPHSELLENGGV